MSKNLLRTVSTFIVFTLFLSACASIPKSSSTSGLDKKDFFENQNAEKLIVFVHGLTGDPIDTWTFKKGEKPFFWPEYLAEDLKNADVYSFGYRSECGPTLDISEIAKSLETRLNDILENKSYKSLSFVAHSMGGLVVREFILSRHEHLQPMIPIGSVVTLSTPNLGSGLAGFLNFFCNNIQMKVLKPGRGEYLDKLNDRWQEKYEQDDGQKSFALSAGYELAPIPVIGLIVEKDSAVRFGQQTQGFIRDHVGIAKAVDAEDELYLWVKQRLLQTPPNLNARRRSDAEEQRITTLFKEINKKLKGPQLKKAENLLEMGDLDQVQDMLTSLGRIEKKVDKTSNDITDIKLLMEKYLAGDIQDNLVFFGLSLGGTNINGQWHRKLGLKYELLFPKFPFTRKEGGIFLELANLAWEESSLYTTLPGAPEQTFNEDNSFTYLSIGSSLYLAPVGIGARTYIGSYLGLAIAGTEAPFLGGLIVGVEFLRVTRVRIALELQWEYYSKIRERKIEFSPFGNADDETISNHQTGFTINLRTTFW